MTSDFSSAAMGEQLGLEDYLRDYEANFWSIVQHGFWKLERQQRFKEPGFLSWELFAAGRWDEAMTSLEDERSAFEDYFGRLAAAGIDFRRLRVVEEPITPYLQWELHVLRLREQCGEHVRIIEPEVLGALEHDVPAPELIILGTGPMYKILYSDQGILAGAVKYTDEDSIASVRRIIQDLYQQGEGLAAYFGRVVAHLEPPSGE